MLFKEMKEKLLANVCTHQPPKRSFVVLLPDYQTVLYGSELSQFILISNVSQDLKVRAKVCFRSLLSAGVLIGGGLKADCSHRVKLLLREKADLKFVGKVFCNHEPAERLHYAFALILCSLRSCTGVMNRFVLSWCSNLL